MSKTGSRVSENRRRVSESLGAAWWAVLAMTAVVASAHHSSTAYDLSKHIEWKVTVTQFQFVNPHAYVFFTMQDASGKTVNGRCELPAVTSLQRVGWTRTTLVPGQKILMKGSPGRNEENVCFMNSFVGEDGKEIGRTEDFTKGGPNPLATIAATHANRPERTPSGHPNLQGPWVGIGGEGRGPIGTKGEGKKGPPPGADGKKGPGRGGPPRPEETEAGKAAGAKYDQPFDDPAIKCDPANILFGWVHDRHVNDVIQIDKEITMKYGYMDFVRTIHLDQTQHPKVLKPSRGGNSIGKWEGDTLVVDTIGFLPGALIPIIGVMHSDQLHIVERFDVDPASKTLTRSYVAEDPLYLKGPFTGKDYMQLSDEPYVAYNCVELSGKNNIRSKQ